MWIATCVGVVYCVGLFWILMGCYLYLDSNLRPMSKKDEALAAAVIIFGWPIILLFDL